MKCQSSLGQKFISFILTDLNELHLWDVQSSSKSRCLIRLDPTHFGLDKEERFTTFAFSQVNANLLAVGFANGALGVVDAAKAQV